MHTGADPVCAPADRVDDPYHRSQIRFAAVMRNEVGKQTMGTVADRGLGVDWPTLPRYGQLGLAQHGRLFP